MKPTSKSLPVVMLLGATLMAASTGLQAKTFKWTSASDIPTWDIHSQNNALGNGVHAAVYESLVYYNSRSFKPEPMLATAWNQVSPVPVMIRTWFSGSLPMSCQTRIHALCAAQLWMYGPSLVCRRSSMMPSSRRILKNAAYLSKYSLKAVGGTWPAHESPCSLGM